MFTVAALTGARMSELCGLIWTDADLADLDEAELTFGWQVDRKENRGPTKTDGSARTVPIPQELGLLLARHKLAARDAGAEAFVFSPPVRVARSGSGTLRGRSARRSWPPSTGTGGPHFPSSASPAPAEAAAPGRRRWEAGQGSERSPAVDALVQAHRCVPCPARWREH